MHPKICHITTLTNWGGVERMLLDMMLYHSHDMEHFVLTTSSNPQLVQILTENNINHFEPSRRFHYDPYTLWQMASWLRNNKIDVVHTYNAWANTWGYLAAKIAGIPIIITGEHGTILNVAQPMRLADKWAQRHADIVIANSFASAILLQKLYGVAEERIKVVHNGVKHLPVIGDRLAIRAQVAPPERLIVGTVGRLDTPKNISVFLDAAAHIVKKRQDTHFVVVGGGPQDAYLQGQVKKMQLDHYVHMMGWRSDAREIVQAFDIYVSTSLQESFGNTLVEAAFAGVPVIAPHVGGIADVVVHEKTGLLLTPTEKVEIPILPNAAKPYKRVLIKGEIHEPRSLDVNLLANAICQLLDNPQKRKKMGADAKQRAEDKFCLKNYVNSLERVYQTALDNKLSRK